MTSLRSRLLILAAVCTLLVGGVVAYLVHANAQQVSARRHATPVAQTSLAALDSQPRIVFRNTSLRSHYGDVAVVSLSAPSGPRALTSTECDRVYAAARRLICLSSHKGIATTYAAAILDERMTSLQRLPLTGIPSRARLSGDGALAATTSFASGDSYAGTSFSTRTVISSVGGRTIGGLEQFALMHDGRRIAPVDRNFWGVTFAKDDDTFYATVEWSKHTWLVRGSISKRTVVTLHEDAECPSLSPDGKYIVFKQHSELPAGHWRLVRYTVATGAVQPLAETRSVDDQVEWLDADHVIYGLPRTGTQSAIDDVWVVPADGSGRPTVLVPQAWSPAVVR